MATEKFSDDVDPSHREPLSVDGAAPLRFPDRPLYDNQIRTFDDREVAALHDQTYEPRGEQTPAKGYSQGADIWSPIEVAEPVEIVIQLTVDDQRKILEHQLNEPVFRMWMSKDEWDRVKPVPDWTAYELSDGRIAIWRKRAELDAIMTKDTRLWSAICQRIIENDVI